MANNIQLAREPKQKQQQHCAEYEPVLREHVSLLRRGLAVSFVFLASAVLLAQLMIALVKEVWLGAWLSFALRGRRSQGSASPRYRAAARRSSNGSIRGFFGFFIGWRPSPEHSR
jgi:hypothetical protein